MVTLKKELGLIEIVLYGVGIILGAGIYSLIGEGVKLAGNSLWISFILAAFIACFTGLSYAELTSIYPKAAAEYVYIREAFGSKILAFLIGWLILITTISAISTISLGFASYFNSLFHTPIILTASLLILLLSYINYLGIKQSAKINSVFTIIEISGLLLIIVLALFNIHNLAHINYFQSQQGVKGILAATVIIFFAYIGFEDIANISEESKNVKHLSIAFILAIIITTVLYILTAIAAINLAPIKLLSHSNAPLATAASKSILGNSAFIIMGVIALFATANTVLVTMIVHSRMMYGMALDRALPSKLASLGEKKRTPYVAIILLMTLSIALLFVGKLVFLANFTSFSAFLTFAFVNLSLIILRIKYPNKRGIFRSPINIRNIPVLAVCGFISSIFMFFQFNKEILLVLLGALVLGLIIYFVNQAVNTSHSFDDGEHR